MKRNKVAINTMIIPLADGNVPEWVELIPAGAIVGRDGRTWNNSKPEAIIASFTELARDLPIDIEHSSELKAPSGDPAPAIAWVKELENRDGAIWGRTEWNTSGKQLIGDGAYRYLSPVIIYEQSTGIIVGLTSVGATNQPNLKLPALNHEQGATTPKESTMLKAILAALGLPENTTEAEVVGKIGGLRNELATAANRAENPSLEKFVPRADYNAALAKATNAETQLQQIKDEKLETDVNTAIGQALKDGKITPATADYHKAQCRQEGGLARFTAYCAAAPAIGGDSGLNDKDLNTNRKALNAEEQKVCDNLGITAEEYLKTAV
jgi:phage I-like protein